MSAGILSAMFGWGLVLTFGGLAAFFISLVTFIEENGDLVKFPQTIQKMIVYCMIFGLPVIGLGIGFMSYSSNVEVQYLVCMEDMKDRDYCDSKFFVIRQKNETQENKGITVNGL